MSAQRNIAVYAMALTVVVSMSHLAGCSVTPTEMTDMSMMNMPEMSMMNMPDMTVSVPMLTLVAGGLGTSGSTDGTGAAARFKGPIGVASDGAGNLYVMDSGNNTIRKIVIASGVVTTLAGTAGMTGSTDGTGTVARFSGPDGAALDGAGNLYVADGSNSTIRQVVVSSGVVTTLAGMAGMSGSTDGIGAAARFDFPYGVAADGAGNLYVTDYNKHTIRKIVIATGMVTTLAGMAGVSGSTDGTGAAARFLFPSGVAVDGAGNLYVADTLNYTIRKVVIATGVVTTLAGTAGMSGSSDGTGAAARFNVPFGMAFDGASNLYVAEQANSTIRKVALANASVTTYVGVASKHSVMLGPLPGGLSSPNGVLTLSGGELIIVDFGANAILAVQ
jgi:sugar lactone lactonase YvrE